MDILCRLGDNSSSKIIRYDVLVSSCGSSLNCSAFQDRVLPDSTSSDFRYPVVYSIKFDLSEGYKYYFQVSPVNILGPSSNPATIQQQFGIIVGSPVFDYVSSTGASVAIINGNPQVWQNGNVSDFLRLRILNIPVVRSRDIVSMTVSARNWSTVLNCDVQSSSIRSGTLIQIVVPILPQSIFDSCQSISAAASISFAVAVNQIGTLPFQLTYFCYPNPVLTAVIPSRGSLSGGTSLLIGVSDPGGALTRQGANLPNFQDVLLKRRRLQIYFNGLSRNYTVEAIILTLSASSDGSQSVMISSRTPPVVAADIAGITFVIDGIAMQIDNTLVSSRFEFVGSKILSVTPASGSLNPGSGGLNLTIKVSNLLSSETSINVLVGGAVCVLVSPIPKPSISSVGTETSLYCQAPELPLNKNGSLLIRVVIPRSTDNVLTWTWLYSLPPPPSLDQNSVTINNRIGQPLWLANGKSVKVSFVLQNVGVTFGRIARNISLEGAEIGDVNFLATNRDLQTSLTVLKTGPVRSTARLSIWIDLEIDVAIYAATVLEGFSVEIQDTSQPRIVASAPGEIPANQNSVFLLGVVSATELISLPVSSLKILLSCSSASVPLTIYGQIPLETWIQGNGHVESYFTDSRLSSLMLGANDEILSQFQGLGIAVSTLASQGGLSNNTILVAETPLLSFINASTCTNTALLTLSFGSKVLSTYVSISTDPVGMPTVFAQTENNDLRSGLKGNIKLTISLQNFASVRRVSDVRLMFDGTSAPVQRLLQSDSNGTVLVGIVPPASVSKVVTVSVAAIRQLSNAASFFIQYYDDQIPVIASYSPFQFYTSPGGNQVQVQLTNFPQVQLSAIIVQMQIGDFIFPDIGAASCTYGASGIASVIFLSPASSISGTAVFKVVISSSGVATASVKIQLIAVPTTRATVLKVSPSTGLSSGGLPVSVTLSNFKMVMLGENVFVNISLGVQWQLLTCSVSSTSVSQTTVNLITPTFPFGGIAVVEIWQTGRRSFSSTFNFVYVDVNLPVLNYVYPSSGITGQSSAVEVSVSRFGIPSNLNLYGISSNSVQNGSLLAIRGNTDGSSVLSMNLFCASLTYSLQNITIQRCTSLGNCLYVNFAFEFRDPNTPIVTFFNPTSISTDGRIPISADMTNLPSGVSADQMKVQISDIAVSFLLNASISYFQVIAQRGSFMDVEFQFIAPEAYERMPSQGLIITLTWFDTKLSQLGQVRFPSTLTYTNPPEISIASAVPNKAFIDVASTVVLTIVNFPGINQISDIVVEFSNSNSLTTIAASIISYTRLNPSMYKNAAQDISVVVSTPIGGSISEGIWRLSAYHITYYERVATLDGFRLSSSTSPQIQGMTSETGQTGASSLSVRRSTKTMITVVVSGVVTAPTSAVVGSAQIDLIRSDLVVSSKTATAVFNVPASQCSVPCAPVYGLITFSGSCTKCTEASCCQLSTCSQTCGTMCRSACFTLMYYDDLAPSIFYQSDLQGPSTGGTTIRMKISNFPVIKSGSDAAVAFLSTNLPGSVYVSSSSASVTDLTVVTPQVNTNGANILTYSQNSLYAISRPDLVVTFPFTFQVVSPTIQTVSPSIGVRSGNVFVTVIVSNFPYPSAVGLTFGSTLLPDGAVSILPSSNAFSTVITFTTPSSATSGAVTCKLYPKACPVACGQAVTFTFQQTESVQILQPVPSRNPYRESAQSITVRLKDFPVQGTIFIQFMNNLGSVSPPIQSITTSASTTAVVFKTPTQIGMYTCNVIVGTNGQNTTLPFPYEVFDGSQIRVISIQPSQASIRTQLYGQTVNLRSSISLTVSNFPQGLSSSKIIVSFGDGLFGDVSLIQDLSSCNSQAADCNKTRIVVLTPPMDVPGAVTCQILSSAFKTTISFSLSFFSPCDFASFCADTSMIADPQQVLQNPPSVTNCDIQYCVDPVKLPDPILISLVPSEGPASGGTLVVLQVTNLPVLSIQSVLIGIGTGAQQVLVRPISIVQDAGSSLKSSFSTITFRTINTPNGATSTLANMPHLISSSLGPVSKQLSFSFQYTPVIVGNTVIVSVYPSSVQSGIPTQVAWQLQNFPKVTASSAFRIIAQLGCQKSDVVRATAIISSSYVMTTAIMVLNVNFIGNCPIQIYWEGFGQNQAGLYNMSFEAPPNPAVLSWFPRRGVRGSSLTVNVLNLEPSLKAADFRVVVFGSSLAANVSSVAYTGLTACMQVSCSQFAVTFLVPNVPDDGTSRIFNFGIFALDQAVNLSVRISSQLVPIITSISPSILLVTESDQTDITIVISNAQSFCSSADSLKVTIGTRPGTVRQVAKRKESCTVILRLPLIPDDSEISCIVSNSVSKVEFCRPDAPVRLQVVAAPLSMQPIDSPCSGGSIVNFTLLGYSNGTWKSSDVKVIFGGLQANGVNVGEWRPGGENMSKMIFSAQSPVFDSPSASIQGYVLLQGARIPFPFFFQCFSAPEATVSPSQAMLDGTTSSGSKWTTVTLTNFPALSKAQDVLVAFDTVACDGVACSVLSFQNLANGLILTIQVPAWGSQSSVSLSVTFRGTAAPPAGGDPKTRYVRTARTASVSFVFSIPAPIVLSARFCDQCNLGLFCIVNARCFGGRSPRSNSFALSGKGVLTIVVDNVPQISYNRTTGAVRSPSSLLLQMGTIFASLRRVIFADASRLAFEAQLGGPAPAPGTVLAQVSVQSDITNPIISVLNFQISIFNDAIKLTCLTRNCEGSSVKGVAFLVSLSNFPLISTDVSDLITFKFGDMLASEIVLVNSTDELSVLLVGPPDFNCTTCQYFAGRADVSLRILYLTDSQEIASTVYTFWSPPAILTAAFHPSGTWLLVKFDQSTDRAGMQVWNNSCENLFQSATIMLGENARCVWAADDELDVFLGQQPTVVPGAILTIQAAARLQSSNGLSIASSSFATVTAPNRVKPSVVVKSASVIDACSALEIRATVASPRPLISYSWMCLNDAALNSYLSSVTGGILSLVPGTPEMQTADKTYAIAFSAIDFLGSSTDQIVVSVFKQAAPTPQVQFNPPSLSITRDQPVFIRGQATFSSCPVDQNALSFSWRLISGPADFPNISLSSKIPQIYVPGGVLTAGSTYVLGLQVSSASDSSQVSEGQFILQVGYQLLVAAIDGGSHLIVSSGSKFTLSSARSYDPDVGSSSLDQSGNLSLSFSWQCTVSDGSIISPCRDAQGAMLNLVGSARLEILGNTLIPVDDPYTFMVTIAKFGHAPATASMPVYVVADSRATVSISSLCTRADFDQRGCCIKGNGTILANTYSRLTFSATSDRPNTTFSWELFPAASPLDVNAVPLGNSSSTYILQGAAGVFIAGSSYSVQLLGYGLHDHMPGQAQQVLVINSPPVGGSFTSCLVLTAGSVTGPCVTVGMSVIDQFRLSCFGWTDPEGDSLLQYRFGYFVAAGNVSNTGNNSNSSDIVWFDWAGDSVKEMSFPSGNITVAAQVKDDCGASTDVLTTTLSVSAATGGVGRRLLASADFWAKARAKVQSALQTFRPDNVNQLTSSMAAEISMLAAGSTNAVALRESLIFSLRNAVDQVRYLPKFATFVLLLHLIAIAI